MPTYTFKCACPGKVHEYPENRTDDVCGSCGELLKRLWQVPGVRWKTDGNTRGATYGVDYG